MEQNKRVINLLTATHPRLLDLSILVIRCAIGIILFVVGASKVLGWFGGMGMARTVAVFGKMGYAPFLIYLSSYTEFLGGLFLILGLFTRPVAIPVIINMTVATISLLPKGFFFGGAAYPFLVLICAIIVLLTGPLAYSLDSLFFRTRVIAMNKVS